MKKFLFLLTGLMCMLVSCGGGDDSPNEPTPTPNPTPNEPTASITMNTNIPSGGLAFDVKGGEKSVDFTTNKDWTVTVAATTGGATWCTASPTSGKQGDATVKFTVKENTDYDDRSVSVTIKAGTASKTFTINQKGAEALLVTTTKYEVEQAGGEIEVEVQANIDYEMEISETAKSWISEATTRALTTHKHTFTIAANEEVEKREGEIVFKSGDKVETIKVYQAGGAVLVLSQNEFNVSDAGDVITIDVKSNIDFGVQMPDADWISNEAATRGMSSHTLKYDIAPNETYDAREAEIVFYDKNSDLKETVKIVQVQKDAIIISNKSYEVKAEGETIEVKLSANVEFDVTMPDVDWISQVTTRGLTEHTLYYKVAENTGEESRSAEIVFTNKDSQISEKITIVQKYKSVLTLDKEECTVSDAGETISIQVKSNVEYEILMPEVDWITKETSTRSASTETIKFVIAPNETYDGRESEIIFKDKNSNLQTTLKITQAQKNAIILSQKEINVMSEGETIKVKLSANVEFNVQMPDVDWISQVTTRGLTEHTLYFEVAENVGEEKRNAEIVFIDKNSQVSDKLTISQFGSLKEGYANGVVTVATAGTMKKLIGDDYLNITSLKIIGFINGDDVYYLRKMLGGSDFSKADWGKLATLDLSDATIVEGGEWYCDYPSKLGKLYTTNNIIGDYMFYTCSNLKDIILPNSAITIGSYALANCNNLSSAVLGNNIKSIEFRAFDQCIALKSINFPTCITDIGSNAFNGCNGLTAISIEGNGATIIENSTFADCKFLTKAIIGDGVKTLGAYMFSGCSNLEEVSIGNNISIIPNKIFENCEGLDIIRFGSGIKKIEKNAFGYDPKYIRLEAIYIHDLAAWCQIDCSDSFSQPFLRGYPNLYVNNVLLTELTIPQGVTNVGDIFAGCKSIEKLIIPEGILSIGDFSECHSLKSVEISNGLNSLGDFSCCKLLSSINIPNSVTSIGEFTNCESLLEIKLGNGITSICDYMFCGCKSLSKVTIGENVEKIGASAFKDTSIKEFYSYTKNPPELTHGGSSNTMYWNSNASFQNLSHEAILYVPFRCGSEYRKSGWWVKKDSYSDCFTNIIEMEE